MDKGGTIFALLSVVVVMTGAWLIAGVYVSMVSEKIEYEVIDELEDDVEIRYYGELTLITTQADDPGKAFSALAAYISGSNEGDVKIKMTAPVLSIREGPVVNMSFVLPEGYDENNAPKPVSDAISIHTLPAGKVAALRFSGYVKDDVFEKQRDILSSRLKENGVSTKGDFFMMRYNPPWVPPALMRNEVAIGVE